MTKLTETSFSYFVVAIDYGRRGVEAVVDPEITRREVVSRIQSGEYKNIKFIHLITMNDVPQDVTAELIAAAMDDLLEQLEPNAPLSPVNRQADAWDRARDLRKHQTA